MQIKLADGNVVLMRAELTVGIEKTGWFGSPFVTYQSFDQLCVGTGAAGNGPENIFAPGSSTEWGYVATMTESSATDTGSSRPTPATPTSVSWMPVI